MSYYETQHIMNNKCNKVFKPSFEIEFGLN